MTDRQIAAKASEHFATKPASKSGTPKATVKKKAANTSLRKTTKKSGK
jgi:hypothetical protein